MILANIHIDGSENFDTAKFTGVNISPAMPIIDWDRIYYKWLDHQTKCKDSSVLENCGIILLR